MTTSDAMPNNPAKNVENSRKDERTNALWNDTAKNSGGAANKFREG